MSAAADDPVDDAPTGAADPAAPRHALRAEVGGVEPKTGRDVTRRHGGLEALRADLAGSAILTDFDGTLAEIVVDPDDAAPLPGVVETLEALAHRAHTVAVVSGRPLAFLTAHFGDDVTLSGLYGLERRRDGTTVRPPEAERWRSVITDTVAQARADLPDDVLVEAKGLAVTLHYRQAPERRATIETWARDWALRTGLKQAEARCSVELNPPLEVDKGTVVAEFAAAPGVRHAFYMGDDRADVAAFEALDALTAQGIAVHTVAVRGAETPDGVLAAADRVVEGPREAVALLAALLPDG